MKQQTRETLKIVVGILIGTVAVIGTIGFMLSLALHPLIIPIVIMLFVISMIIAGVTVGYKGVIVTIGSFVFGCLGFNPYYHYACGPNSSDVKVMKPMAQKISEYIVKNGIPESLKDIPDLPYALEGCEKKVEFIKHMIAKDIKINNSKNATYEIVDEKCNFTLSNRFYEVYSHRYKYFDNSKYESMTLRVYQYDSKTGVEYDLKYDKKWKMENNYESIRVYDNKTDGICKPWKQ